MFLMLNTGVFGLIVVTFLISFTICQNSLAGAQGSWFSELFNTNTRSSGASLAYQLSAVVSGFTAFWAVRSTRPTAGPVPRCCSWSTARSASSPLC